MPPPIERMRMLMMSHRWLRMTRHMSAPDMAAAPPAAPAPTIMGTPLETGANCVEAAGRGSRIAVVWGNVVIDLLLYHPRRQRLKRKPPRLHRCGRQGLHVRQAGRSATVAPSGVYNRFVNPG